MPAERGRPGSTRETAPPYNHGMRSPILLLPLLFILADGAACKDDEPTGADFGEACGQDDAAEELPCGDDLMCELGYCEEVCEKDEDCRSYPDAKRVCFNGACNFVCNTDWTCPDTLPVGPLQCMFEACISL